MKHIHIHEKRVSIGYVNIILGPIFQNREFSFKATFP